MAKTNNQVATDSAPRLLGRAGEMSSHPAELRGPTGNPRAYIELLEMEIDV